MRTNPLLLTDSYKITHSSMMPKNMNYMFDYIEARKGGEIPYSIFFGLQMFIKDVLNNPFTNEDIDEAEMFFNQHFPIPYVNKIFDKKMFKYILKKYNGYFPVKICAVPEGTKVPEGNVLCTFECDDSNCPTVVSFLETMALSYIWYGTTVATNSFFMKQIITNFAQETSEDTSFVDFALHDFGARGVIPGGQKIGGAAHLINFKGSDTLEGIYAAMKYYNSEMPAFSIPATEHSVMCSEGREGEMIVAQKVFDYYAKPNGIIAMVNDTYDMVSHIKNFSKIFKEKYLSTGVRWVTRPDSGLPQESVLTCLNLLWEEFGGKLIV